MAGCLPIRVLLGVALALNSSSYGHTDCSPPEPPQEALAASSAEAEVGFELHPRFGAILIRAEVNREPAVMILDTGSSRTILSPRITGLDVRELERPADIKNGSGVEGEARWGKASLRVGPRVFRDQRVVVLDLQEVSHNFGREIDGLLGQDVLCEFERVVIDFKKRKVTFGARP